MDVRVGPLSQVIIWGSGVFTLYLILILLGAGFGGFLLAPFLVVFWLLLVRFVFYLNEVDLGETRGKPHEKVARRVAPASRVLPGPVGEETSQYRILGTPEDGDFLDVRTGDSGQQPGGRDDRDFADFLRSGPF